jgi:hypothetical protein
VTITELFHQNNSILSTYYTLTNATISSVLNIGTPPSYNNDKIDPNSIPITFNETLNQAPCGAGSPNGTACPDYWQFNAVGTGGSNNGFQPLTFGYNGNTYEVDFQLLPVSGVTVVYLGTGVGGGDVRVWTNEDVTSRMDVQMKISQVPVPEPATLTLLGLGLLGLGLGYVRRRKKND